MSVLFTDADGREIHPGDEILYIATANQKAPRDESAWHVVVATAESYGVPDPGDEDESNLLALFIRIPGVDTKPWMTADDLRRTISFAPGERPKTAEEYWERLAAMVRTAIKKTRP